MGEENGEGEERRHGGERGKMGRGGKMGRREKREYWETSWKGAELGGCGGGRGLP